MAQFTEIARAKVNLTLRVLGRRPDGYHDLDSIVAFADCADRLTFDAGGELGLEMTGAGAAECGAAADNLVVRAARLLSERVADLQLGHFTLDKQLPVAAGIGGGSADAAAALRLLAAANGIAFDDSRLFDAARATGADVPVCLASRACVMGGVGDDLTFVELPALPCVMINPRISVPTKDVFSALGLRSGQLRVGFGEILEAVTLPKPDATADQWISQLAVGTNDLEKPALRLQPIIGEVLSALRDSGARLARMSGSGATCFAIFTEASDAERVAQTIAQAHPDWWVHAGALS